MPIVVLLCLPGKAQHPGPKRAIWNPPTREIIYMEGPDSVFSIALDKTFYAQLNHENIKKHKTVRYRLARYTMPIELSEIPVVVTNNNTLLAMRGKLQGDTAAFFSLMFSVQNEVPVLEVLVSEISVNEFSFQLHCLRTAQCPAPVSLLKDAALASKKRKKHRYRIHIYGHSYRIAFTGE